MRNIKCLVKARFGVGESPVWDGANTWLLWSDNTTDEVHAVDLASRERRVWHFGSMIGSLGVTRSGRWIVAVDNRVVLFDPRTETTEQLVEVALPDGIPKLNDGKVGPDGAFWVGGLASVEPERLPIACLYRVTPDGGVEEKVAGGIKVSNGLAWSPDARMMYHCGLAGRLDRCLGLRASDGGDRELPAYR